MNLPGDRFGFGAVDKYANLVQVEHAPSPLLAVKAFGEIQAGVLGRFGEYPFSTSSLHSVPTASSPARHSDPDKQRPGGSASCGSTGAIAPRVTYAPGSSRTTEFSRIERLDA